MQTDYVIMHSVLTIHTYHSEILVSLLTATDTLVVTNILEFKMTK